MPLNSVIARCSLSGFRSSYLLLSCLASKLSHCTEALQKRTLKVYLDIWINANNVNEQIKVKTKQKHNTAWSQLRALQLAELYNAFNRTYMLF